MIELDNHPNIVRFLDVVWIEEKYFIFMEEANGGNLADFQKTRPNGWFTEEEAREIVW